MIAINTKLLSRLLIACSASFSFYIATAQGSANENSSDPEMEKLFSDKKEHASYLLKFSNTGSNYYWIESDSLFSCSLFGGRKIAIADIDLSKTRITRDKDWLVKDTKDPVYKMELFPLKGKPAFRIGCLGIMVLGAGEPYYDKTVMLDMADSRIAGKALEYLKHLAHVNDEPTTSGTGFDSQLGKLINGLKDDYAGLQGSRADEDDVNCSISLEGAISTKIHTGMLHDVWLNADFGDFYTLPAAEAAYHNLVEKINISKGKPCPMVKQEESISEPIRTQAWLPFDLNDKLDRSMKQFSIQVDLIKLFKFDKDFHQTDYWSLILRLKK